MPSAIAPAPPELRTESHPETRPEIRPEAEHELRFLEPAGFTVPASIAGLEPAGETAGAHRDHYLDASGPGGAVLRRERCNLRVRELCDGTLRATFKRKRGRSGALARRIEIEGPLACAECTAPAREARVWPCGTCGGQGGRDFITRLVAASDHPALAAAREHVGARELRRLYAVDTLRVDHRFVGDEGELMLSQDTVTYPDGSVERRVEVELARGDDALLERAERELRRLHPELEAVKRGKASEARKRLRKLLG